MLLCPNTYNSLHITTPIYLCVLTYFYAHNPIHVCIFQRTYIFISLHTSPPIYQYMIKYLYALTPIRVYIYLRPYAPYTFLYASTPIYAQYLSTYFETDLRPLHVYILLCPHTYVRLRISPPINPYVYTV